MRIDLEVPEDAAPGTHGVYVLRDAADEVLYIGCTQNLYQRLKSHRSIQPWWRDVRSMEWSACSGYAEARAAEKSLIALFHPDANRSDFVAGKDERTPQRLPDWCVAKLTELREQEAAEHRGDSAARGRLDAYIAALRDAGWRLAPIGLALGMTRERVRQRQARAEYVERTFGVPSLPRKPEKPKAAPRPTIPPTVLTELRRLQPAARRVNGVTPLDSSDRVASLHYTEILAEQYLAGVAILRIATQLGVTPMAIRARLARHGYVEEVKGLPGNTRYGTVHPKLRSGEAPPPAQCKRGHSMTVASNVRHINGDPKRPTCRACERIRCDEYRARKAGAA